MSRKHIFDAEIARNLRLSERYSLLELQVPATEEPFDVQPGQFVEIKVPGSATTYLRRPISICDYDSATRRMTLLIRRAGDGTEALCNLPEWSRISVVGPLGNGFTVPSAGASALLAGGGIGVAPLLLLGKRMLAAGVKVTFLLAARTAEEVLMLDEFRAVGATMVATDDGTMGQKGFAHEHDVMKQRFDLVCTCGPKPMMMGIARKAKATGSPCEVSLENLMACGLGACLCCVEPTLKGNLRACVEGPVFNTSLLLWDI